LILAAGFSGHSAFLSVIQRRTGEPIYFTGVLNMKRLFFLPLILAGALALTACGGGDSTPAPATAAPTTAVEAAPAEAAPAEAVAAAPAGDPDKGKSTFDTACIACHGPGGVGVQGLGKSFVTSEFVTTVDDAGLVEFIKVGRAADDPANTTGIAMLPKGGNPAITDEDLLDIVAYIRTLHE